jgi:hypothetical protein
MPRRIGTGDTHSGLRVRRARIPCAPARLTARARADSSERRIPHHRTTHESQHPHHRPVGTPSAGNHLAPPIAEGNIVNTSSLTAGSTQQSQATALRAQARQLNERLARRAGFALLAWSRRRDARRASDAVLLRRQTEQRATEARDDQYRQLALRGAALV